MQPNTELFPFEFLDEDPIRPYVNKLSSEEQQQFHIFNENIDNFSNLEELCSHVKISDKIMYRGTNNMRIVILLRWIIKKVTENKPVPKYPTISDFIKSYQGFELKYNISKLVNYANWFYYCIC